MNVLVEQLPTYAYSLFHNGIGNGTKGQNNLLQINRCILEIH